MYSEKGYAFPQLPNTLMLLFVVPTGKAAGSMKCVGLRNQFTDDSKYSDAGVDVLLDSVAEFVPETFGLPPYSDGR